MEASNQNEIGIKYFKLKFDDNFYLLFPIGIVDGYSVGNEFLAVDICHILNNPVFLESDEYLVDGILGENDLYNIYEVDDGNINFLKEYYFNEERDYVLVVEVKNDKLYKRKVDINILKSENFIETYERQKGKASIILNQDVLNKLLNISNIEELKKELIRYQKLVASFKEKEKKNNFAKIIVQNGKVVEIEADIKATPFINKSETTKDSSHLEQLGMIENISLDGLYRYVTERVFGHEREIKEILSRILMNYRSSEKYGVEPILIFGPTGTGKTETVKAAAEYLDLPFIEVNSANLVPQGIKGSSIEDYLYSLIVATGSDVAKAQRAMIFFDEFDKLAKSSVEFKGAVATIMLKFLEGDKFFIDKTTEDYTFNTKMLNKVYAGAFQDLFDAKKLCGFNRSDEDFDFNEIYKKEYFGKELVTRIPHKFLFNHLDRETQKRLILKSKLSKLLQKKERYQEQFGVDLVILESYVDAILNKMAIEDKSMRDLNNVILKSLCDVEIALLENEGKAKKLILSSKTVSDSKDFDLL